MAPKPLVYVHGAGVQKPTTASSVGIPIAMPIRCPPVGTFIGRLRSNSDCLFDTSQNRAVLAYRSPG